MSFDFWLYFFFLLAWPVIGFALLWLEQAMKSSADEKAKKAKKKEEEI